jgi:hypothetical protein
MIDFKKLSKAMAKNQKKHNNNGPVHTLRCGVLSVSIWRQDGSNGTFYRCNAQRAYSEGEGQDKEWKHTDSFGRDDVLIIAELFRSAWQWIRRAEMEDREKEQQR